MKNKITEQEIKQFTYHPLFLRVRTKQKKEKVFPPSIAKLLSHIYKSVTALSLLFLMTKMLMLIAISKSLLTYYFLFNQERITSCIFFSRHRVAFRRTHKRAPSPFPSDLTSVCRTERASTILNLRCAGTRTTFPPASPRSESV